VSSAMHRGSPLTAWTHLVLQDAGRLEIFRGAQARGPPSGTPPNGWPQSCAACRRRRSPVRPRSWQFPS
jgi:hypothetical protein